jgi:hypothetical protein
MRASEVLPRLFTRLGIHYPGDVQLPPYGDVDVLPVPPPRLVLGNVALPAGTPRIFILRPAMLERAHFGRPDEFLPERWSNGHPVRPHEARAYAQFGAGPRVCPGRYLASVQMRLVLSMLTRVDRAGDTIKEISAFAMVPSSIVATRNGSRERGDIGITRISPSDHYVWELSACLSTRTPVTRFSIPTRAR